MPDRCSFCKLVGGPLIACWGTHGLRDRLGGRRFKPRFLFFFDRKLGLERWLPPRAFVLGVDLSALLLLGPSLFLFLLIWSPFLGGFRFSVFVLMSALCGVSLFAVVLLPLAGAYVVGGGVLWRGWLCMLRCLCLFFCFALLQRKPERCYLVHAMLASSSLCPVLLLLVHMLFLSCLLLFECTRARGDGEL